MTRSFPAAAGADPRSDEELVAACNRSDSAAFEAIYHRYRDWVVTLARRFTGHDEDALDVLQEVFAYLLGKFPGLTLTARLTTFLYPAVKHTALALKHKRRRYATGDAVLAAVPASPGPDDGSPESEIEHVVRALPDHQREVLLMRFVDEMSLAEIAAALALPAGTVKSRLHRAVEALRSDGRTRRYFEQ